MRLLSPTRKIKETHVFMANISSLTEWVPVLVSVILLGINSQQQNTRLERDVIFIRY